VTETADSTHARSRTLPPGPREPAFVQTLHWVRRPTELMNRCRARYGPTFTLRLPMAVLVFLSDPAAIRAVFTARPDEMHAGEVNRIMRVLVGDSSVLLLDRAEHARQRKLLMPSFHGERMRLYGGIMVEATRRAMATWPEGAAFPIHPHTQEITLEVILRCVFGVDRGARLTALRDQITRTLARGETTGIMLFMQYLANRPEAEARLPWRWFLRDRDRGDAMVYDQIRERRSGPSGEGRSDVLSMLLAARDEAGEGMSDPEIRDELVTALVAGHETTATALAWAFERVLGHPPVLDRLRDEVRGVAGGAEPDPEKLAALPFLDATIKEVLRLRPVIPVVGRVLQKPFTFGVFDLPAGTTVAPCIYLAQRDPEVYPDPEAFRPERFLGVQPDPYSWLPFGGGARRCIGAAFAVYEMKVVLGTILAGADLALAQRVPARIRRRAITFWPERGTRVTLQRRLG
jgi:cytochrome P450